jgi:hypothetical protein
VIAIPDFVPHAPVPADLIDAYRDRVPEELVELWQEYGFGTFGEGFVRVIDPRAHEAGIGDVLGKVTKQHIAIPIMVTGFADVVTWDPGDGVTGIMYRVEDTTGLGSTVSTFVKLTVGGGAKHLDRKFDWGLFPRAVATHGALAFDESFVFVPLLSLGGPKDVAHLQPRKTIEAIRTMVELQGVIEH